ncbi:MAG: hypothetical protein MJY99_00140 [Fibrobacter sp.]|nr:hypothetical protein [Fibrobacter sp.]
MNKKFKYALGFAVAAALVACGADSIDAPDSENWPSDFSTSEYARVNPDLAIYQCITAVSDANTAYLDSAREVLKNELMSAGLDEKAATDSSKKLKRSFSDEAELATFFSDSEEAVKTLFTDYANINADYWPGIDAMKNGMTDAEGNINIDGQRAMEYRTAFEKFHRYGNTAAQDLAFLQSIKIDSSLIRMQYIMAGKYEGRAYRSCREGEAVTKKLDITVTYDTLKNADTVYVYDTVMVSDTAKASIKYVISYTDSTGAEALDTLLLQALEQHKSEDSTIVVTDTLYDDAITTKPTPVKVDSTISDKIKKTTVTQPTSSRIIVPKGSLGRVWDFSNDYYCLNEADGVVYLIGNP